MSVDQVIGEAVHTLMWRHGVSQVAMAGALGLDQSALSRKLHGARPWKASEVMAAADFLGVSPGELYPQRERVAVAVAAQAAVGNADSLHNTCYTNRPLVAFRSRLSTPSHPSSPRLVHAA